MTAEQVRLADLRSRLAALNCELLEDQSSGDGEDDHYYVLDKTKGKPVSICASLDDTCDWLAHKEAAGDNQTPSHSDKADDDRPVDLAVAAVRVVDAFHAVVNTGDDKLGRAILDLEDVLDGTARVAQDGADLSRRVATLEDKVVLLTSAQQDLYRSARLDTDLRRAAELVLKAHADYAASDWDATAEKPFIAALRELAAELVVHRSGGAQ